jgi:uncharacterized membrane protein YkvA (DUF1232 family)
MNSACDLQRASAAASKSLEPANSPAYTRRTPQEALKPGFQGLSNMAPYDGRGVKSLEQAQQKADKYLVSKEELSKLVSTAAGKAHLNYEFLLSSWESLHIVLRMIRNWLSGRYSMPITTVLGGIAAVLYFVDPFDLIPDSVPVLGYLDDAAVIAAFVRLNLSEISRFRNWEVSRSFYPRPEAD